MQFLGADIRIVNIPKNKVAELVREFVDSSGLHTKRDEELDAKATHIRASNEIDSYLRFWWKGTPQIIDWRIVELDGEESRIETRFGLQRKYRVWFWGVMIILSAMSIIFMELCRQYASALVTKWFFSFAVALLAFLLFAGKSVSVNFDGFVLSFWNIFREKYAECSEEILQSEYSFPDSLEVVIFVVAGLLVLAWTHFESLEIQSLAQGPAGILIFCLTLMSVLAFFSARNPDFSDRLRFALPSLIAILPIIIFYSSPYVIGYNGISWGQYKRYVELQTLAKNHPDHEMLVFNQEVTSLRDELRKRLGVVAFSVIVLLVMVGFTVACVLENVDKIKEWRAKFFSNARWTLLHRRIVDFKGFGRQFSYSILTLWIGVSVFLYVFMYGILAVLEFVVLDKNVLFVNNIGQTVCEHTVAIVGFFLSPLMGQRAADLFTRLFLIMYCAPLLWMSYKVVRKRIRSYVGNVRERKRFKLDNRDDSLNLYEVVGDIARSYGVSAPDIVVVPSRIPFMKAKYIGFPYFRSYVLLSKGCLRLERNELIGLLAHEIYHVKKHSFKWYALNLLSEYTLFGRGFLAVTTNSYRQELDADRYATEWVKKRGSVLNFLNGLQIMDLARSGFSKGGEDLQLTDRGNQINEKRCGKRESKIKSLKRHADTLFEIYFGEEILSYIHPPLEERIERIRALAESADAK